MPKTIQIKIGEKRIIAVLNESDSAKQFFQNLPLNFKMERWGDEYYGDCGVKIKRERDARTEMDVGEIALWPDGNALCIFFGPTPASTDQRPKAISPVNPIGKIEQDVKFLKDLPHSIEVEMIGLG